MRLKPLKAAWAFPKGPSDGKNIHLPKMSRSGNALAFHGVPKSADLLEKGPCPDLIRTAFWLGYSQAAIHSGFSPDIA
jgi:hypothetical protein